MAERMRSGIRAMRQQRRAELEDPATTGATLT
jgi:hypothetical protein